MLRAAGHEAQADARAPSGAAATAPTVLVVDLGSDGLRRRRGRRGAAGARRAGATRTLGVYSHVDVDTSARADAAGFDLVVPRSRMAREMPALVERTIAGGAAGD